MLIPNCWKENIASLSAQMLKNTVNCQWRLLGEGFFATINAKIANAMKSKIAVMSGPIVGGSMNIPRPAPAAAAGTATLLPLFAIEEAEVGKVVL